MQSFFRGEKLCKFIRKNSVLLRHSLNPNGLIWCLNMAISFVNMLNIVSSAYIHDFVLNACDTFDDKLIFWLSYVILMNIYKLICHLTSLNPATIYLYNFLVALTSFIFPQYYSFHRITCWNVTFITQRSKVLFWMWYFRWNSFAI